MDLNAVADGIAAAVKAAGIKVNKSDLVVSSFAPMKVVAPSFFVAEFSMPYHRSHGGLVEVTVTCRLMISIADPEAGQRAARSLLAVSGDGSIPAAIEAARGAPGQKALDGACDDIVVRSVTGPRLFQIAEVPFYGLEFILFAMG